MSEEIRTLIVEHDGPRWILSGADHCILEELYTSLWNWVPDVSDGAQVSAFGRVLTSIEALIEDGTPPSSGLVETDMKPAGSDGVGVCVSFSPSMIEFSATSYVWMGEQGHDHGAMPDEFGVPFSLIFTPDGSFDRERFDRWVGWAELATGQQVHGHISKAYASYSEENF